MNTTESKFVFKNTDKYIQIFCPQKYKGYYIRGWVEEVSDYLYSDDLPECGGRAYYHFLNLYLISPKAEKNRDKNPDVDDLLDFLNGKTRSDFLKTRKNYLLDLAKQQPLNNNLTKETINIYLQSQNDPIEIPLSDLKIIDSSYLKEAIEKKEDIILLHTSVVLDRTEMEYPKHIYQLAAYHAAKKSEYKDADVAMHLGISSELRQIGDIAWEWLKAKCITNNNINTLNTLHNKLRERNDPNDEFNLTLLNDLIDDLKKSRVLNECSFCGNFFRYSPSKKYCSLASENKNCGTSARNKRYYSKHKNKILPRAKEYARKYRAE